MALFNTITINGVTIYRPNDFELVREDVYRGEYTSISGRIFADRVGWKYADMTLHWDVLTPAMLTALINFTSTATITFTDSDGVHSETIIRTSFTNTPTRITGANGQIIWSNIEMGVSFINVHNSI